MGLLAAALAPVLAVPAVLAVGAAGPVALVFARSRRERAFVAGLPAALEQVAAELRGGGTVAAAVDRLAAGRGAVSADLRRVHVRTQLGLPLADALAGWPADHDAPGVRAAAGALAVATTMGGRAADAIDGLASSLRHRLDAVAEAALALGPGSLVGGGGGRGAARVSGVLGHGRPGRGHRAGRPPVSGVSAWW